MSEVTLSFRKNVAQSYMLCRVHRSTGRLFFLHFPSTSSSALASRPSSRQQLIFAARPLTTMPAPSNTTALSPAAAAGPQQNNQQPEWVLPTQRQPTPALHVYNSLTRSKTPFVTRAPNQLTWYNCGPTVYDASHMGHARNYVSQDIIRRILRDYFAYDVHLVMNITDIDDKIIIRARHRYLLARFKKDHAGKAISKELVETVREAWSAFFKSTLQPLAPPTAPLEDGEVASERAIEDAQWESIARLRTTDTEWVRVNSEKQPKLSMWFTALDTSRQALLPAVASLAFTSSGAGTDADGSEISSDLINASADILAPHLDAQQGSGVSNPSIFRSLAAHWERAFFQDMARLRVERPTTLTRVSEYVPEIVTFVQKIVKRGFAYEDERGNVWFDTRKFDGAKPGTLEEDGKGSDEQARDGEEGEWKHAYAKLAPWSKGNRELIEEGEGSLSTSTATISGKRHASDFALWKTSKAGEPAWPSPWGSGRPGWHIECSVMGSDVLGAQMDIHSGGEDLCFPHHDNELAQSEAAFGCRQWVNYFLHTGHLHIEGLKMSKSLKNFITIEAALGKYSARQLRLAFLNTTWNAKMDFGKNSMVAVASAEQTFNNFFGNINAMVREAAAREAEEAKRAEAEAATLEATADTASGSSSSSQSQSTVGPHGYNKAEADLMTSLTSSQAAFRRAMADSFDTPQGLSILLELVSKANVYERSRGSRSEVNLGVLQAVGGWVGKMLRMWGLGEGRVRERDGEVGWGTAPEIGKDLEGDAAGGGEVDREALLAPYLRVLSSFRDSVRSLARSAASAPVEPNSKPKYPSELLALADRLRDFDMAELGVSLEDQDDGKALVKFVSADQLRAAREEKERAIREKEERKQAAKAAAEAKRRELLLKGATPASGFFRSKETCGEVFGGFDERGIPTLDGEGKELSKKKRKNVEKEFEKQVVAHQEYLKAKEAGEI